MLKSAELQMLKDALYQSNTFRPLDQIDFGSTFETLKSQLQLPEDKLKEIQSKCADYILCLCNQIISRVPSNIYYR